MSDRVPWVFLVPNGWTVSVGRSAPDPNLMTGVLQTWATNAPYRFTIGHSPSPNGTGGASETLGSEAAVVEVQLLWFPPEQDPTWSPSDSATQVAAASGWHSDAQNPGWVFRERTACRGKACVHDLEWHGPGASDEEIGVAQKAAESTGLKTSWP
jgi:hypothetical protein